MAIVITKQPADFVCTVNETAIFTFEATGVTKYQWQCLDDSGYWNNLSWSGYNTATMTRALNMNNINYQYRCELTDADGNKMYTRTVRVIEPTDDIGGLVNASTLHAIAEAIRAKTETTDKILPADMAAMIESIGGIPDGVTELEVAICAPTGLITLPVPCSMSATPTCVVAYQKSINGANAAINACMYFNRDLVIIYGGGTLASAYNKCTFASGVFKLNAAVTANPRFQNSDYVCVMWR